MKDLKKGIKLMAYGLQFKTMIGMFAFFLVFGVLMEIFLNDEMGNMGGFYFVICGSFIYQLIITSSVASYISSSPLKKKIQTTLPSVLSFLTVAIFFTVFVVMRSIRLSVANYDAKVIMSGYKGILLVAILAMVIQIYNSFAYKFFWASTIGLLVVMVPIMIIGMRGYRLVVFKPFASNIAYVALGYVLLIVGVLLSVIIGKAIYKREIDPMSTRTALARAGR
ncbi:MAG: hypothetical protein MJ123_01285 [Lachnospiraceae bacterium]|nr:hypothetical protein [Lachnospiraceae bacterium]